MAERWDVPALLAQLDRHLEMARPENEPAPVTPPAGYRADAKGRLVPERNIPDGELLEDQTVRVVMAFAVDLANQIARFRANTTADMLSLLDALSEQYGQVKRGRKGNWSAQSYDGRLKVVIQRQERIDFGPELQVARDLIGECIAEWSDGARDELRLLVQHAFEPDQRGNLNREAILKLRRTAIEDPRWTAARQAIGDSIRVVGARNYLRFYWRAAPDAAWRAAPIDIAGQWSQTPAAGGPEAADDA